MNNINKVFGKWTLLKLNSRETCWRGKNHRDDKIHEITYLCRDNVDWEDMDIRGCYGCFNKEVGEQK